MPDGPSQCPTTGKRRHATGEEAHEALRDARRLRSAGVFGEGKRGRVERSVYLCPFCGGWHTTSKKRRRI